MDPTTDARQFRNCLSQFATGVTVITCRGTDGQACGTTANSFSSVSLAPPLVLWSIAKTSSSLEAYTKSTHFAIHVLADNQQQLSNHFAVSGNNLFDDIEHRDSEWKVPLLDGCLAIFECETFDIHDAGDHYIIVGKVERFSRDPGQPLLFFAGAYRNIETTPT